MKTISQDELKTIQLSLLDSYVSVCEKNGLRYYLDYGTLLGCIRHKGFIPWDDDIDVSMPRSDYKKLVKLFERNDLIFGKNIKLAYVGGKYDVNKAYLNLIDNRTITESIARESKYQYPVWIDIFPMDLSTGSCSTIIVYKIVHFLCSLALFPMCKKTNGSPWILPKRIIKPFLKPFISNLLQLSDLLVVYQRKGKRITMFYHPYDVIRISEDCDFYNRATTGIFEGKRYRIPANYDERLRRIYGNYNILPPVERQIPHTIKAYWKE